MQASQEIKNKEGLKHLAVFSSFLLKNHREQFLSLSYKTLVDLNLPLFHSLTGEDAKNLSDQSALELLNALAENDPYAHIQKAIERWKTSQFPKAKNNQFVIQDVTLIGHSRKLVFLQFIPSFTSDVKIIIDLLKDIEAYLLEYTATTLETFVGIMDDRIHNNFLRLQESELLYKQAETIAHIGNWKWDVGKNKVYWTDELYRIYGLEPAEEINFEIYMSFAHPEDKDMMTQTILDSLETKSPYEFFHRIITKDLKVKMLHSRGEVLVDSNGKVYQLVGSAQDVTTQKEIERQLLENQQTLLHRTQELQQSNASLEEFAYVASHDLKEPLRKISIFIDRLDSFGEKYTEKEKQYLDKIANSAKRMKEMIDDLLSLSLVATDKTPRVYNLKKLLNEVLQTFDHKLDEFNAVVNESDLPDAYIVHSQFSQVFQNLIANSLKFTRPDVQPVINITHRFLSADAGAQYNLPMAKKYLEIKFSDNGIGFDPSFADKIFAVFQRLHHKEAYEGTGIGLAICRKIIKNHGGTILATGEVNKGATFTIIIPVII